MLFLREPCENVALAPCHKHVLLTFCGSVLPEAGAGRGGSVAPSCWERSGGFQGVRGGWGVLRVSGSWRSGARRPSKVSPIRSPESRKGLFKRERRPSTGHPGKQVTLLLRDLLETCSHALILSLPVSVEISSRDSSRRLISKKASPTGPRPQDLVKIAMTAAMSPFHERTGLSL